MKKIIEQYPNVLKKLENNYLGENAVLDKNGIKYSEGITHLDERTSIQVIMNELVSDAQYEVKYKDLTVLPEYLKVTPKLDVMFDNNYFEYKKVKIMYDRGGLDEYVLKKLVNPSAAQSYVNPFTKQSVASSSLTGDIEKVSMLCGEECNRYVLLELWGGKPYTAEPYINMIDSMVNTYYNVERFHNVYNGIHPKMTQCDILCYKILD